MPTPPQCVCILSEKAPLKGRPGWFEYTFRCHWAHGTGGPRHLDTHTYTVGVDWKNDDAGAAKMAKDKCPYEPKFSPENRKHRPHIVAKEPASTRSRAGIGLRTR